MRVWGSLTLTHWHSPHTFYFQLCAFHPQLLSLSLASWLRDGHEDSWRKCTSSRFYTIIINLASLRARSPSRLRSLLVSRSQKSITSEFLLFISHIKIKRDVFHEIAHFTNMYDTVGYKLIFRAVVLKIKALDGFQKRGGLFIVVPFPLPPLLVAWSFITVNCGGSLHFLCFVMVIRVKKNIGSSTFFANLQCFIAKEVLDPILTNTFFYTGKQSGRENLPFWEETGPEAERNGQDGSQQLMLAPKWRNQWTGSLLFPFFLSSSSSSFKYVISLRRFLFPMESSKRYSYVSVCQFLLSCFDKFARHSLFSLYVDICGYVNFKPIFLPFFLSLFPLYYKKFSLPPPPFTRIEVYGG